MPRPRFAKLPPERQKQILDMAADAFAKNGYERASYNQILEETGLSKGVAYYMFDGKADLYATVLRRELEGITAVLKAPRLEMKTPADFWAGVHAWLKAALHFAEANPRTTALLRGYVNARREGVGQELDREMEQMSIASFQVLLSQGIQVGAIRTDVPMELLAAWATAVLTAGDTYFLPRFPSMSQQEREAAINIYVDALARLLRPLT